MLLLLLLELSLFELVDSVIAAIDAAAASASSSAAAVAAAIAAARAFDFLVEAAEAEEEEKEALGEAFAIVMAFFAAVIEVVVVDELLSPSS